MCKMLKPCLVIVSIFTGIKLFIWWDRRRYTQSSITDYSDDIIEDSDSELSTIEENCPKLWSMKKEELINECKNRGLNTSGTVRVLRERVKMDRKKDT